MPSIRAIVSSPFVGAYRGIMYWCEMVGKARRVLHRLRNWGKKEKSPHGDAELASDKQLKAAGHFHPDGYLMGHTFSKKAIYAKDERNVLVMAYPGAGKSQNYIAYLRSLGRRPFDRLPHMVIGDASNELFRNTATILQGFGVDVSKIGLLQPEMWNRYDPLVELPTEHRHRLRFARQRDALCELIVPDEPRSREKHFLQFSRLLIKCAITVNVLYEGNDKTLSEIVDELLDEDKRSDMIKRAKKFDDTVVKETLKTMSRMADKPEGLSMMTTSLRKLEPWTEPAIREATTAKRNEDGTFSRGWSFREILTRDTPTAIFLRTGFEESGGAFARVVYGSFVNAIGDVLGETDAPLKRRAEALVDEGGLTGYCNAFVKGYSRFRKAGFRLRLSFVSYAELMSTYGDDGKTMWDGFNILGFGGGNAMELNRKLSELTGKKTIYNRSGNQSKHGSSSGWSETGIPLMSEHEIRSMAPNECVMILDRMTCHGLLPWQKHKKKGLIYLKA